jgi:hypothetical protein
MTPGFVMRRRAAWLIPLPLAVSSWLGAHCMAYWLVSPAGEHHHMGLHAESGHAYLGYTPALVAWGLALVVAGLLLCVGQGLRGCRPSRPPVRLFVLLPPLGFVLQEHLERLVGSGAIPYDLMLEPTFLVGLALQLPFALAGLLLAHALRALGFGLGRVLARQLALGRPMREAAPALVRLPALATLIAPSVLDLGHGPRAPPVAGFS